MSGAVTQGPCVIHKHVISLFGPQTVVLARSAQVMHVAFQSQRALDEDMSVWFLVPVTPDGEPCSPIQRTFEVRGTGEGLVGKQRHLGSALVDEFVWHLFEHEA